MSTEDMLLEQSLGAPIFNVESGDNTEASKQRIEIRLQTNGRRKLTIVSGLTNKKICDKICEKIKKTCSVGGTVKQDEDTGGWIIQTQGDKRFEVGNLLVKLLDIKSESITRHGY